MSNCSVVIRYDSSAVFSVLRVTVSRSSTASICRYWSATDDTSEISAALRDSAVDRYCASAWSFRLRIRPKKSISHDAFNPTEYVFEIVWLKNDRFFGVRVLVLAGARIERRVAAPRS